MNTFTTTALYSADQTRELDCLAIEKFGHAGLELMEKAGESAFRIISKRFPASQKIAVLCGPGNNGGDGYVVARLFHNAGISVDVIQGAAPVTESAKINCTKFVEQNGNIDTNPKLTIAQADLIVDGLLGSGITRAPEGLIADLIHWSKPNKCPIVSLDIPSGLNGNTGRAYSPAVSADLTVTFIAQKTGLFTADGPDLSGDIHVESLGLEPDLYRKVKPIAHLTAKPAFEPRKRNSHKGLFGSVLIAGGDQGMPGAVMLAGSAGLRCGAGLVSVLTHDSHKDLIVTHQPELMSYSSESWDKTISSGMKYTAVVIGPGISNNQWGQLLVKNLLPLQLPRVVDAGGLRILADMSIHNEQQVLTPHPGEAGVLLGVSTKQVQNDRIAAARAISKQYGGVCVLKGAGTIICQGTKIKICDLGNPGMASAGMGDVLSGIIGAFLAQGLNCFEAACTGVWIHSASGDRAAERTGQISVLASDVINSLPKLFQQCQAGSKS